jgi:hypothetical protein
VPFVQLGPEVLMRWSSTLTVVFVNWDPWEVDGVEDCVGEGLVDGVPEGLPDCVPDVVAALHAVMDKGGLKGTPPMEHN